MIFNLFKSKPTLKNLIPNGFVDIHSHKLPGIDDGAKNIEESLELISAMKFFNSQKLIGTPHVYNGLYNNSNKTIKKAFNKVNNTESDVLYAAEYFLDESLLELSRHLKKLLCLKGNFILIEMSFMNLIN